MAIDDELDARKGQYPEPTSNAGFDISIKALTLLGGSVGIGATILDTLRSHFSTRAMIERLQALVEGLENMVRQLEEKGSETKTRIRRVEERLNETEFAQAFVKVANVAVFTPQLEIVCEFGSILGYEAASNDQRGWGEAAALVEDLSRLTKRDLQVLRIMVRSQGHGVSDRSTPQDYDVLDRSFVDVVQSASQQDISTSELYARALRLSGFGLARPLNWNQTRWAPQDMAFAPTPRGKRLIQILTMP
jgi:hypothetical protein